MTLTKDDILGALTKLTVEELQVIHTVAENLLAASPMGQNQPSGTLAAIMFEAMAVPMNVLQPYAMVAGTKWGKQFNKHTEFLYDWLMIHFPGWDDNKVTQLAFLRWLFTLLANDLRRRNLPRSLAMVNTNVNQIPRIVSNAFPGYLEAGLGKVILKNFQPLNVK